jgi:hypothetical protein
MRKKKLLSLALIWELIFAAMVLLAIALIRG